MVKFENTIQKYCGLLKLNGKTSHHMGSTSIIGMPGKPLIDFTIITDKFLIDIVILKSITTILILFSNVKII